MDKLIPDKFFRFLVYSSGVSFVISQMLLYAAYIVESDGFDDFGELILAVLTGSYSVLAVLFGVIYIVIGLLKGARITSGDRRAVLILALFPLLLVATIFFYDRFYFS